MTDNTDKLMAEALVEQGYADDINEDRTAHAHQCGEFGEDVDWEFRQVDPFADTLESRRQADALEDWLHCEHYGLWFSSQEVREFEVNPLHQWRLDRIKWCFEQLAEKS